MKSDRKIVNLPRKKGGQERMFLQISKKYKTHEQLEEARKCFN